jgi:nitroreductase
MDLDTAIKSRHSVRRFSDKKPDWRDIIECIDAARYAPMAGNNFSLKFILVDDKETIAKLDEAASQKFLKQAQYVVVFCSGPTQTTRYYGNRGWDYLRQQAGAAIENFLLSIEAKGLATCWVGHFLNKKVKEALKIPATVEVEALCPIGYEHKIAAKRRQKINLDNILYFNKYKNKKMTTAPKSSA